jgi:hypothetical protein
MIERRSAKGGEVRNQKRWRSLRQVILILGIAGVVAGSLAVVYGGKAPPESPLPAPEQSGPFSIFPSIFTTLTIFPTGSSTLSLAISGNGAGNVTSNISGDDGNNISCNRAANSTTGDCSDDYTFFIAPNVILTATAQAGSNSGGWTVNPAGAIQSGCGATSVTCEVNMTNDVSVSTAFTQAPGTQPLAVLKSGPGQGTVTSAPPGINCGADCVENFTTGTVVVLTAAPNPGSTFGGWSGGGCTGTGTCSVTMSGPQTVTAMFNTQTFPLTVTISGQGAVASNPPGIACPSTCTANYGSGTSVTLTAVAAQGWQFQGWSGAGCSGTGTCTVAMTAAQSVTATFAQTGPPPPPQGVDASVTRTRITKTGPLRAIRQLKMTVRSNSDLSRIRFRVRRNGITLQSKRVFDFEADTAVLIMNLRNTIGAGPAQLQINFTGQNGAKKQQNRGISIPRL